ncbi:hypothetical protein MJN69_31085, partial [Salmonella enterica subsp. enterica serovar Kentucky]|nr:hypothetical protein [Salmonella enterica subsp. enterica serovar Kentucky]
MKISSDNAVMSPIPLNTSRFYRFHYSMTTKTKKIRNDKRIYMSPVMRGNLRALAVSLKGENTMMTYDRNR